LKLVQHTVTDEGSDQGNIFHTILDTDVEVHDLTTVNLCAYCKIPLRTLVYRSGLCTPCKELYKMHFIRRDYGVYRKNTAKQRSDILSDELNENPI
jgi:hypothetical protein|tara:strand:- start:328 stop:615 length:288 start_codon:yes stop_codon:yes gene_type:complete